MKMDMDMSSYFTFSRRATVLFKFWKFDSIGSLIGSMFAIYAMAFTYEGLKFFRTHLLINAINIREINKTSGDDRFSQLTILSKSHLIQTLLYGVQGTLSYFLMLIFMTFNGWLCLAVVGGLVSGYFVFEWKTPAGLNSNIDDNHCQ
ncbi:high affinity copper uptake protein 1-like [Euwallacea fornicatus]|uniref:high affinity copper uptake protein 1-like n=1 Tax=Euwallacea fornicatus TaxID=995702 RepID=UPI00338D3B6B